MIHGYCQEWKPGEFIFSRSFDRFSKALPYYALYKEPQPGCPQTVTVYRGDFWVTPHHNANQSPSNYVSLYRGPLLNP